MKRTETLFVTAVVITALLIFAGPSRADESAIVPPAVDNFFDDLFQRETLTADWFGYRKSLENRGIVLGSDEIIDVMANPIGGASQGGAAEGRFELFANVDLGSAIGWNGATLHANAYWIHGAGPSSTHIGNLLTVSSIEAKPSTRLFTLWIQQSFFGDAVSVRAGQIAADDEFFISQTASLFINSTFGWPSVLGINLPSGGPAYPLATPGIRVRVAASPSLVVTAAAFNGDPAPAGPNDPQIRDATGTSWRTDGGLFLIGELAYSLSIDLYDTNLPGTAKLGGWYHSSLFADQRFDTTGLSLANPLSTGMAALHRGDYGAYFIFDQLILRNSGSSDQGLNAFFRIGGNPGDRNLIELHLDTGMTYTGLLPGRENDVIGIGISYERISDSRRDLARDLQGFTRTNRPLPDFESALEFSYQAQVTPWLIAQPDVQYVIHPGARLVNVGTPAPLHNPVDALVLGLRLAVSL